MTEKLDKGKEGEEYAIKYLSDKGFKLKTRNYTSRNSEIDLVFTKENLLLFVEVRLKFNADYGFPEDSMSKGKINALKRGAEAYLTQFPWEGKIRFDFVSIVESPKFEIMHFEDAVY